jgi:hypothetical protein
MAITHEDAVAMQAVERYLLGELTADERDQFEAHVFDCVACAEDLKAAALFLDSSRSVLRESAETRTSAATSPTAAPVATPATDTAPRRGWLAWLNPASLIPSYALLPVTVVLLGFTLYQNLVTLPALRQSSAPRALFAFSFVSSGTRGATPMAIAAPTGQPFLLFFDIPPGGRFTSYHCTIVAEDGTPQLPAVDVSAAQARDTVQLFIPASQLRPGRYALVITGDAGKEAETGASTTKPEIARYPFVLQGGF